MIKLYHCAEARSMRSLWLLHELGVPFELVQLGFDLKQLRSPEYLAIHPLGRVPCLVDDGRVVALGSGRQTRVLAVLLLSAGEVVPRDLLIDALWGDRPPATASNALQVQVHALRKRLGQERIATDGPGYRLVERAPAGHVVEQFGVPDGLARGA